jgi:histidinol-phosphatase (PHP family)
MIVDYHMHLRGLSRNGEGPIEHTVQAVERFVETGAERGVDELGFSEHVYYFREFGPFVEHPSQRSRIGFDLDDYCDAVVEAKRQGLPVKLGLEVDYFPGRHHEVADLLAPYPWDFLLGSVHLLDGEAIDQQPGLWARLPIEEVWSRYFDALRELARSGLVDVLAHPDLVKIYGRRPSPESVAAHHEQTVAEIDQAGVTVEVSTAGLRRPVGELYPAPDFLQRCRKREIAVTTASDAHHPGDVGRDLDRAVEALSGAGYETVTVYEERKARQEPLG